MEKQEKQSTEQLRSDGKLLITNTLDAFTTLHKEAKRRGRNVVDLSDIIGIAPSAYYRYISDYKSQKKFQPSYQVLSRFAEALGYEIKFVEKK